MRAAVRRFIHAVLPAVVCIGMFALHTTPAHAQGAIIWNNTDGTSLQGPSQIIVDHSTFTMIHNNKNAFGGTTGAPMAGFVYYADGTLYGAPQLTTFASTKQDWDLAYVGSPELYQAKQVLVAGSMTFTVTMENGGSPVGFSIISIEMNQIPISGTHGLYLVADTQAGGRAANEYIEELDNACSTYYAGGWLSVSCVDAGSTSADGRPTSRIYGEVACVFGAGTSGCGSAGPADGSEYGASDFAAADAAIGYHWDLTNRSTSTIYPLVYVAAGAYPYEPADDAEAAAPVAQCLNSTDVAVSPAEIALAPGGSAVLDVAVRNTDSVAQGYHDLVVSLSDGLRVTSISDGINLGQRAALEGFILQPNETRTVQVQVTAAEQLPAAPLHITELYCGGRVVERIDGVFIPTAAAAAVTTASLEATTSAETAAVAVPLPAVLPNTAGTGDSSAGLLTLMLLLAGAGLQLRRRA
jgi:hypothetical protein